MKRRSQIKSKEKRTIILASSSEARKKLMKIFSIGFEIEPSNFKEDMSLNLSPIKLAEKLALGKAEDVAKRRQGIIIAADTFAYFKGSTIGKPSSKSDAKEILQKMSGKTVNLVTGIAVIDTENKKTITDHEITKIKIKKLSEKEIDSYIATGEPMGKAGAICAEGKGALFVERIDGCFHNVLGLPIFKLAKILKTIGIDAL